MIKKYLLFTITAFLISFSSFSQRNIIEVPTSRIVDKGRLFFQEQVTISNRNITSGTVFTWGLGHDFEAGFNLNQLTINTRPDSRIIIIDPESPEENPDILINAQKGLKLKEWYNIGIGTKTGLNIAREWSDLRLASFTYFNNRFSIYTSGNKVLIGIYYGNHEYVGEGNNWGYMMGATADIIKDKFRITGDYISGNNSLSLINIGFQIGILKEWQIAFAAQLPVPESNNHHGVVIQLSRK